MEFMTLIRHTYPTPNFSLGSVMKALAPHWSALLALALFFAAGLAVLDDYGVIEDAAWQRRNAEINLDYLADGDLRAFTTALYVDVDKFYGMAFEIPLLLAKRAFGIEDTRGTYILRHLITRLLFLSGGLFAYMLALRLFGSRLPAVAAMLLFLLHPRIYAHSFFNPKDIPFLAMFMAALFLTHRAFKRDKVSAFVPLGLAVGLLVNLRIMGVVLLAAIPAMRALDFAAASGWEERKRVLLTTGAFALAAPLTAFALLPYLWGDPVGRAVEWWATLSNYPAVGSVLFRGTLRRIGDLPPEYLPVWFSITAPPFALLLGAVGAAGVFAATARAPRKALRNGRLRFALLLAGAFIAPILWVVAAGPNMYDAWRQMYFLWGPFALLTAFGLRWIISALGRRRLGAAAYGAASAGLAATAVSMALLHPNQQEHFNLLLERVEPERLRSQYAMDYWQHPIRQRFEWIIEHPAQPSGGPSAITASRSPDWAVDQNALMLPESERERLADAAPFGFVWGIPLESWSRTARELHRLEIYGSTLWTIESRDDLREVYEAVRRREPLIDGRFDVHRIDGALALVMEPCAPAFVDDERAHVFLRAFPVDAGDLPAWREGKAFEPRAFHMANYGAYFEGKCVASLPLPAYPIADFELRLGVDLMDAAEAREKARRVRDEGRLLARAAHRAAYDVYLADGELAYLNDTCDPLETEHPFHLNVYPERADDLPEERREHGFERFHFEFLTHGAFVDGGCAAFFRLPDYPVAAIRTGQRDGEGGDLWLAEFLIDPGRRWAESASGASGEPIARGEFDVYLSDGALVYVKEPCERGDTEARFFLHIMPERVGDLPEGRRVYGFDNLDFDFFLNGALFEERCAARAALPDYAIASIRTGQYEGEKAIWVAEFAVGK